MPGTRTSMPNSGWPVTILAVSYCGVGLADDPVVLGVLQRHGLGVGRGDARRIGRPASRSSRLRCPIAMWITWPASVVQSPAAQFQACGRGADQHGAGHGADAAQVVPVHRRGQAAAGELAAVELGIVVGLLDADVLPVDVQLLGDHHRQRGLDALTDLRVLGHDGDDAVGRDAHIGVQRRAPAASAASALAAMREAEHQAAADDGGLQEVAARGAGRVASGHGAHAFTCWPEACLMAARMRV